MDDPSRFDFVGGDPSLDLVNTLVHRFDPNGPLELLDSPEAALDWYEEAALLEPGERGALKPRGEELLESARRLRAALSRVYLAISGGEVDRPEVDEAVEALNDVLERARERVRVRRAGNRFAKATELERIGARDPAVLVARSAAGLLERLEPRRLKECANPGCDLLFYDETRNNSRRWCSMDVCGNRLKQARFRRVAAERQPQQANGRPPHP